jgi:beta-xylosidase
MTLCSSILPRLRSPESVHGHHPQSHPAGFNPDPAFCRVSDNYYIATSTFEWHPGVQIYHSRDLVNCRLTCRPLKRVSQLDMCGNPDS